MPFCGTGAVDTWPAGVGRLIRELETDQTTVFTPRIIVLSSCFASRDVSAALFSPPDDDLPDENPAVGAAAGATAPPLAVDPSCRLSPRLSDANLATRHRRMRTSSARPSGSFDVLWKMFSTRLSSRRTEVVWIDVGSDASWMLHEKR